jgi:ketosteroid isomerase-like protein
MERGTVAEDPNIARARGVLEAVSARDFDRAGQHLSEDIVWHVGGKHPLSGDYRGHDAVHAYHSRVAELTGDSLRLEPIDILASDHYLGIFLRATAETGGRSLDTTMVEAVRLAEDGRWAEFWALADDQDSVDEFWKAMA